MTLELSQTITFQSLPAYLKNAVANKNISSPNASQPGSHGLPLNNRMNGQNDVSCEEGQSEVGRSYTSQELLNKVDLSEGVELEGMVEDLERGLIEQALEKAGGNKTEAARLLGISFRSMRYRLKKYGYE